MFEWVTWLATHAGNLMTAGSWVLTLKGYYRFDPAQRYLWLAAGAVACTHLLTEERPGWFFTGAVFGRPRDHQLLRRLYLAVVALVVAVLALTPGVNWRVFAAGVVATVLGNMLPLTSTWLYASLVSVGHSLILYQTTLHYVR
jgi:hypothetical protein